jgi:hypothetical protein
MFGRGALPSARLLTIAGAAARKDLRLIRDNGILFIKRLRPRVVKFSGEITFFARDPAASGVCCPAVTQALMRVHNRTG